MKKLSFSIMFFDKNESAKLLIYTLLKEGTKGK